MNSEIYNEVKMAQRFYYLAVKYESRVPKSVVKFAKKVCNVYTKKAKDINFQLSDEELLNEILK